MSPPVETQEIANEYRQVADRLIDALTENHDAWVALFCLMFHSPTTARLSRTERAVLQPQRVQVQ